MRRTIIYISVAGIAFLIGLGCDLAFRKYLEVTSPKMFLSGVQQSELIDMAAPLPFERNEAPPLPPGGLPAELQRIDERFKKRCELPTVWAGEWLTIKQIVRFRECNEEWANARRAAINAELQNYMVRY